MGNSGVDENTAVTAGLPGFLVLFCIGLVLWFLFRDMSKRMRNIRRAEEMEQADDESADATGRPVVAERGATSQRPTPEGHQLSDDNRDGTPEPR